jgi:hypothetical protein
MGLLLLGPEADALAVDELLEDLDEPCLCEHPGAEHDADGCRACVCGALGLIPEGPEDDAEFEAEVALVTAALRAARSLRKRLDNERRDRVAQDPTRSPRANRPRVAPKKAATPRSKAIARVAAPSPQSPAVALPSYEDDGRIHFEEDALGAVLAG